MPKQRTVLEASAGKLISAIQREWGADAGESTSDVSEQVMHSAHALLAAAAKSGSLEQVLAGRTINDYLGPLWVRRHPAVVPAIRALELAQRGVQHP